MDIGTLTGQVALEDQLSDKLTVITSHVKDFVSSFDGMTGAVVVGAGAIAAAVTGAVISIVSLGEKGSTILGVEDAFNKLAASAGSTGDAMIGALTEGVRGTVDSMELMQSTTKLLSSGLKVGAGDLKLMAQTAREMGKATGTDAATGLNILSTAMVSGNARALKRYGIQIDLVAAEKEFRKSIGNTTDALTAAGKLEVNHIAVMEGMRVKMAALGVSSLSFKERMQQVTVSMGDWVDSLAKAVASSPRVLQAFDTISDAIKRTFGGSSQELLDWIVKWVNRFADAVTRYGPPAIALIGKIKDGIVQIWDTVTRAWDLVPDWFKHLAKEAGVAAGAVYLTSKAFSGLGGPDILGTVASFATITSGMRDFTAVAMGVVPKAIVQIGGLYNALKVYYLLGSFAGGGVTGGLAGLFTGISTGLMLLAATPVGTAMLLTALAASIWQVVKAIEAFGDNWKAGGGTMWGFLALKDDNNFVRRWTGLSTGIDTTTTSIGKINTAVSDLDKKSPITVHVEVKVDSKPSALDNFNAIIHDQVMVSLSEVQDQIRVNWTGTVAEEGAYWARIKIGFTNVTGWAKSAGESISTSLFGGPFDQESAYWNRLKSGFSSVADWLVKRRKELESGMTPTPPPAPKLPTYGGVPTIQLNPADMVMPKLPKLPPPPDLSLAGYTLPNTTAYDNFVKSLGELSSTLDSAAAHHMPLTQQVKLYGDAAAKAAEEAVGWGAKVSSSIQRVAAAANDKAFKEYQDKLAAKPLTSMPGTMVDASIKDYIKMLDARKAADKDAASAHHRTIQSMYDGDIELAQHDISDQRKTLVQKLDATNRYYSLLHQKATDSYNYERKQIVASVEDQVQALDKGVTGWETLETSIRSAGDAALTALDTNNGVTQLKIDLDKASAAADTLKETLIKTFQSIPETLISAFEGGGGISGALKSIATQFGQDFGKAMGEAIAKQLAVGSGEAGSASALSGKTAGLAIGSGVLATANAAASGASTGQQFGTAASTAAQIGMMAHMAGATVAASAALAAYTAGAGVAVIAAIKIYKAMNDGRKVMQDYYKTFQGGADELRQKMLVLGDAGEAMWKKLTQQTGKGDKAGAKAIIMQIDAALAAYADSPQAAAEANYQTRDDLQKIADKAKAVYDYMVASGKYTAEAIADAFQKSKDATIAAMSDEGRAHAEAMDEITARYATMFDKIDTEYKSLSDSVAAEAEEAVMGDQEIKDRARMKQLEADKAALEEKKKQEELTADRTYDAWVEAGKTADQQLRDLFAKGYDAPLRIKSSSLPPDSAQAEPHAGGGFAGRPLSYQPSGSTDTVLTNLTPGELILNAAQQSAIASKIATPDVSTRGIEEAITSGFSDVTSTFTRLRAPVIDFAPKILLNNPAASIANAVDQRPRETTDVQTTKIVPDASFDTLVTAGTEVDERLRKILEKPYTIPVRFEQKGGLPRPPIYMAGGGMVPRGTDTVPAMLTPGEEVTTASESKRNSAPVNPPTITLKVSLAGATIREDADARKIGEAIVTALKQDGEFRSLWQPEIEALSKNRNRRVA